MASIESGGVVRIASSLCLVFFLASTLSPGAMTLYLDGDGAPVGSLVSGSPTSVVLPNHDPWRDATPGLVIERGGLGAAEVDPDRFQQWVGSSEGMILDDPVAFVFWAAMRNFQTGSRGKVEAFLMDCDPAGQNCIEIGRSSREILDWSGGWGSWREHSIEFGRITHTVDPGRALSVKITVAGSSDDDMWFAYGSSGFPGMITTDAISDVAVDCDFGEWWDPGYTEFLISDQGGPDDWASPAKLDVTLLGVSSNRVDAFQFLIGLDDAVPQGTEMAALVDVDLDGNMDRAVTASLNGSVATISVHSCDDTLADGCGTPVLEGTYSTDSFCMGAAPGPWDQDTLVEIAVPFSDLGVEDSTILIGPLVSYAGAALLTSAKDSIFGSGGEIYSGGIHYGPETGESGIVDTLGSSFIVRRDTDPASVRSSSPVATVTSGPFDDASGVLVDGQTWFYVVEREGGLPVEISVHVNPVDGAVRIGFDDVDALSAPADPALSTVSVSTASVPADGSSRALVTILPRDTNGVPLGGGCALEVDPGLLSPGVRLGPVHDNYDGTYTFEVTATAAGTAQVAVEVEGVALAAVPQIVFY